MVMVIKKKYYNLKIEISTYVVTTFSPFLMLKINPYSITLKIDTDKQHIKANSHTKFCMNLIYDINDCSCKKKVVLLPQG